MPRSKRWPSGSRLQGEQVVLGVLLADYDRALAVFPQQ